MFKEQHQIFRFLVVGIGNTLLGLSAIYAAMQITDEVTANLIGYLIVVPVGFLLHRDITFRDSGRRLPAFIRFIIVVTLGYIGNRMVLDSTLGKGINSYVAQFLAISAHVLITYTASRLFVFISPKDD